MAPSCTMASRTFTEDDVRNVKWFKEFTSALLSVQSSARRSYTEELIDTVALFSRTDFPLGPFIVVLDTMQCEVWVVYGIFY